MSAAPAPDAPITADEALAAVDAYRGEIDANAARALAAEVRRLRGLLDAEAAARRGTERIVRTAVEIWKADLLRPPVRRSEAPEKEPALLRAGIMHRYWCTGRV